MTPWAAGFGTGSLVHFRLGSGNIMGVAPDRHTNREILGVRNADKCGSQKIQRKKAASDASGFKENLSQR